MRKFITTEAVKEDMVHMRMEGKTFAEIGAKYGVSREYAYDVVKKKVLQMYGMGDRPRVGFKNCIYPELNEWAKENKVNAKEAAEKFGIKYSTFISFICGKFRPTFENMKKIEDISGVNLYESWKANA